MRNWFVSQNEPSYEITPFSQGFSEKTSYVKRLETAQSTQAAIDIVKKDIIALESETNFIGSYKSEERK